MMDNLDTETVALYCGIGAIIFYIGILSGYSIGHEDGMIELHMDRYEGVTALDEVVCKVRKE